MWKWPQGIAPNHLLCYTTERLGWKKNFGVMVPLESLDEPQLWVEGCVGDHWMSKEALENLKKEARGQTEQEAWGTGETVFEGEDRRSS